MAEEISAGFVLFDFGKPDVIIHQKNVVVQVVADARNPGTKRIANAVDLPPGTFFAPELVNGARVNRQAFAGS